MMATALQAELTKIRSVRATLVALALTFAVSVGIGLLEGGSARAAIDSDNPLLRPDFSAAQAGFDGVLYGQLALIVFGVLLVSGEYGGGMISLSLVAVPRRGLFFAAKMASAALAALAVAIPSVLISYAATQLTLGPYGASALDPGVPRAMAGAVGYLMLMCLLSAGFAMLARNAILPLAVLLPLVLIGSQLLTIVSATAPLARYLPDQAGRRMVAVAADPAELSPLLGLVMMLAWTAAALIGGYIALRRWDA